LLDGDPLVVFIAFSIAVSWNLFLLPFTIGLTAGHTGASLSLLALELLAFWCTLGFSFYVRNKKIIELNPYLTREELLWSPLSKIATVAYGAGFVVVVLAALSEQGVSWLTVWPRPGIETSGWHPLY
jgi:hypothetical protein